MARNYKREHSHRLRPVIGRPLYQGHGTRGSIRSPSATVLDFACLLSPPENYLTNIE